MAKPQNNTGWLLETKLVFLLMRSMNFLLIINFVITVFAQLQLHVFQSCPISLSIFLLQQVKQLPVKLPLIFSVNNQNTKFHFHRLHG